MQEDEIELLKLSLSWLRFTMFGEGDFTVHEDARRQAQEKLAAESRKRQEEKSEG
jgi:triphosphoribosyl-dephospho-CoA synthetase